jgi:hypothetical protein
MTTYVGNQRGRPQHNSSEDGNAWIDNNAVTVPLALTTADAVVVMDVPAGTEVNTLRFYGADLDTGTGTLTANIGYRTKLPQSLFPANATYFAAANASFAAATTSWQELTFPPIKFDEPVEIVLIPAVAANALAAPATVRFHATGKVVGIT